MSKKIESQKEALSLARNAIENAAVRGPWMNITVCLEMGELSVNRQTWDFPKEKLSEAVELIKNDLTKECVADALPDDPLPEVGLKMIQTIPMGLPECRVCNSAGEIIRDHPPRPVDLPTEPKMVPATPDELSGEVKVVDDDESWE